MTVAPPHGALTACSDSEGPRVHTPHLAHMMRFERQSALLSSPCRGAKLETLKKACVHTDMQAHQHAGLHARTWHTCKQAHLHTYACILMHELATRTRMLAHMHLHMDTCGAARACAALCAIRQEKPYFAALYLLFLLLASITVMNLWLGRLRLRLRSEVPHSAAAQVV